MKFTPKCGLMDRSLTSQATHTNKDASIVFILKKNYENKIKFTMQTTQLSEGQKIHTEKRSGDHNAEKKNDTKIQIQTQQYAHTQTQTQTHAQTLSMKGSHIKPEVSAQRNQEQEKGLVLRRIAASQQYDHSRQKIRNISEERMPLKSNDQMERTIISSSSKKAHEKCEKQLKMLQRPKEKIRISCRAVQKFNPRQMQGDAEIEQHRNEHADRRAEIYAINYVLQRQNELLLYEIVNKQRSADSMALSGKFAQLGV